MYCRIVIHRFLNADKSHSKSGSEGGNLSRNPNKVGDGVQGCNDVGNMSDGGIDIVQRILPLD